MKILLTIFVLCFIVIPCLANSFSIHGTVVNKNTLQPLVGSQVYLDLLFIGSLTNNQGEFTIKNVKPGNYVLVVSYIGFETMKRPITAIDDITLKIEMEEQPLTLETITIQSDKLIDRASVSDIAIDARKLETYKGFQEDPISILLSMPGISKGSNDLFSSNQLYVRGGDPNENLFLYDNVKIHWPWYYGGIKSIFNYEIIDNLELLTGGFSAKYGNAMSSVVRVTTREGNMNEWQGNFSLGFSGMQLALEGPIQKDKVSILTSFRKTYLDFFMGQDAAFPVPNLLDGSYNIKLQLNNKHSLSLSGLNGKEKIDYIASEVEAGQPGIIQTTGLTNATSIQWRSLWTKKLYSNTTLIHSQSDYSAEIGKNFELDLYGTVWGIWEDASYYLHSNHCINFGGELNAHHFTNSGKSPLNPSDRDLNDPAVPVRKFSIFAEHMRSAVYLSYTGDLFNRLAFTTGYRSDYYYHKNQMRIVNHSPRVSMSYKLNSRVNIRTAYGYFYQFPDNEAMMENSAIESNLCKHYISGLNFQISPSIAGWFELYYKDYSNLIVYDEQMNFTNTGKGTAKGIECFLTKQMGKYAGWISYAYSIAKRKGLLLDKEYYSDYDRRHMLNLAAEYNLKSEKSYLPLYIQINFRMESGKPYTPIFGAEETDEGWRQIKGTINSKRDPIFHNLNIKMEWLHKKSQKIEVRSYIEIWNLYNRKNLMGRAYDYDESYPNNLKTQKFYSTPFIFAGGFKILF